MSEMYLESTLFISWLPQMTLHFPRSL